MKAVLPATPKQSRRTRFGSDDQKWAAVQHRNAKADAAFVFSVKTTGVYCRPSCPSRPPHRENVAFHASCDDAERAGFRACKRCQPNGPDLSTQHAELVAKACRMIETSEPAPRLERLARGVGLSPAHFHRIFTKIAGVTPKAYALAHRRLSLRRQLRCGGSVTEAIYAAGFPSSGRFYADAAQMLGMKPKSFQHGGTGEIIRFSFGQSSLGPVLVAASARGVCAVLLGDDGTKLKSNLRELFPKATLIAGNDEFSQIVAAVIRLVEQPHQGVPPLDIRGTIFQQKVWSALFDIPPGETTNYTEIARRIARPSAVRAVASACGANKIAVAIPCHRVVRNDGNLAGYRWGIERKRTLLRKESA